MAEPAPRKMSSQVILEEALKAREQFLKEQPHLQSFQDEIDRILEKTVGFENRMSVLAFMIRDKTLRAQRFNCQTSPRASQRYKGFLINSKLKMPMKSQIIPEIRVII